MLYIRVFIQSHRAIFFQEMVSMVTFLEEMGGVGRGNILEMECFLGFFFLT